MGAFPIKSPKSAGLVRGGGRDRCAPCVDDGEAKDADEHGSRDDDCPRARRRVAAEERIHAGGELVQHVLAHGALRARLQPKSLTARARRKKGATNISPLC